MKTTTEPPFWPASYSGAADLPAIAALVNICQAADNLENRTTPDKLQQDFADPTFDVAEDLRLWRNAEGQLMAMAELWRQPPTDSFISYLGLTIHPAVRNGDLADVVLAWAEQRVLSLSAAWALPVVLHAACRDTAEGQRSLIQRLGFQPERYFWRLQRSLTEPLPKVALPDGWCLRSVTADDAEPWVEMYNQTFVDHWNHTPVTVEEFHHWLTHSDYDANLDLVIESPEGQMAAFAGSVISADRNARLGIQEGHVCLLGTRRGYRRLGLARALLAESLRRLQWLGMTTATIGVDSQNPSGAVKLYQSVGFEHQRSSTAYRRVVKA